MSKRDRLDMLKKISFIRGNDMSIFEAYIPDHYNEIYSLYTLLKDLKIDYSDISFDEPLLVDDSLTFVFDSSEEVFNIITKFLNDNDDIISYSRKHKYLIEIYSSKINEDKNRILIKFIKI